MEFEFDVWRAVPFPALMLMLEVNNQCWTDESHFSQTGNSLNIFNETLIILIEQHYRLVIVVII